MESKFNEGSTFYFDIMLRVNKFSSLKPNSDGNHNFQLQHLIQKRFKSDNTNMNNESIISNNDRVPMIRNLEVQPLSQIQINSDLKPSSSVANMLNIKNSLKKVNSEIPTTARCQVMRQQSIQSSSNQVSSLQNLYNNDNIILEEIIIEDHKDVSESLTPAHNAKDDYMNSILADNYNNFRDEESEDTFTNIDSKEIKILVVDDNDFNIFSLQQLLHYKYNLPSLSVSIN